MPHATRPDGTRLHYRVLNDAGSDKRAILVHSLAMDGSFWALVAEQLPDWAIMVPDCRGHGVSDHPAGPYTAELFADDMAAIMSDAGWDSAICAGASMGGCVALALAAHHPQMVRGLGLFDTTACYGEGAPEAWDGRAAKARSAGLAALVEFQKTRWFSDAFREANPDLVESAVQVFLRNDLDAYVETCRMLGRVDLRPHLPALRVPTEVIVGEEDYATPVEMAEALAEEIEGATLEILPKVRHLSPIEVPATIAAALERLAARCG